MKKILILSMSLALALMSVGCSSSGDITDIANRTKKYMLGQQQGLISGSQQNYTTSQGYVVSSSIGNWTASIRETSADGYTVYTSVQGTMNSESSAMIIVE